MLEVSTTQFHQEERCKVFMSKLHLKVWVLLWYFLEMLLPLRDCTKYLAVVYMVCSKIIEHALEPVYVNVCKGPANLDDHNLQYSPYARIASMNII